MDKIKLIVVGLLVAGGIFGFYWYEDQAFLYRVLGLLVVLLIAAGVYLTTTLGGNTVSFGRNAVMEMRKSVWPTRQETWQTTLIVLVMVSIIGVIIWIIDTILRWVVESLI